MEEQTTTTRRGETYAGRSREQRSNERRARIMASAVHLFGTRDYDDVTVADICAGAKVSKRYFYEHFDDRPDLLLKVNRDQNEWLLRGVAAAIPERPATLEELFRPALHTLVDMLKSNPESARVIYVNAPRMETRRRGVLREDAQFVAAVLRRAGGRPQDQSGYDRTLLALVAGLSEVIIDWISHDMVGDPDRLADHLTGIALALTTRAAVL
ncbi:transcriptional regulator [Paractinoplanes abujensis]|uniref:AcrR family transcriptional regulator n=1 Tax=Paractinoplanes abujensis TaxID=882441 RepID=A0A7W7G4B9_9ACTN|nr:TetR/AcrR family transcriptional regulator [Actinoplanes abujensis]MBB4695484.1 AcrR family transcriptional regulator [Actinoplanes abujensis]GID23068.1 transcriptional regulator [Actinoplanes abujensis]